MNENAYFEYIRSLLDWLRSVIKTNIKAHDNTTKAEGVRSVISVHSFIVPSS